MFKPIVGAGIASLIVLCQSVSALAVTVQDIPNPRRMNSWVADTADLLTPQTEAEINRTITALEAKNGSEIAIVTVATTKPAQSSKAFATELFNTWKIGKRGKNNGVLFLISKSDRRTEIETGTGLTALLPSSKVEIILTQTVTPQYKQGKFNEGTLAGTRAIAQALGSVSSSSPVQSSSSTNQRQAIGGFVVILFFVAYYIIFPIIKGLRNLILGTSRPRDSNYGSSWDSSSSSSSSGDSSSSDSSSSSSSDFGGGSSDGGGSGDSW